MNLTRDDNKKIQDYYKECLSSFGPKSAASLSWSSETAQKIRFKILSELGDLDQKTVLDVGCGLGDLYGYLISHGKKPLYTSIDLVPEMIKKAKEKYPDVKFICGGVDDLPDNSYDYVLASGALSFNIENYREKYFSIIRKMFFLSKAAAAFNLLDKNGPAKGDLLVTWDSDEVRGFCKTLTPNVQIIKGYTDDDFTVKMYH